MKYFKFCFFIICVCATSCFNPDSYLQPDRFNLIHFAGPLERSIVADDSTSTNIEVYCPVEAFDSYKSIMITTTAGYFADNKKSTIEVPSKIVSINGEAKLMASVRLKAGLNIGKAIVTAKVGSINSSDSVNVNFINAFPTIIKVDISAFSVKSSFGSELTITATIARSKGNPSINNVVEFAVFNTINGNLIGEFRSVDSLSNAQGTASAIFGIKDDCCIGEANAVVSVKDSLGVRRSALKKIYIVK